MNAIGLFLLLRSTTLVLFLVCAGSLAAFLMRFRALAPLSWAELRDRPVGGTRFLARMIRVQRLMNVVGDQSVYEPVGDRPLNMLAKIYRISYPLFFVALFVFAILKWVFLRDAPV